MNVISKKLSITLLAAATVFAPLTSTVAHAESGAWQQENRGNNAYRHDEYRRDHYRQRRHNKRVDRRDHGRNNSDAIALGIIGLGAAAIIGGAIANSQNNPRVIYQEPAAPRAVSGGRYEPWSRSWYRFCEDKYRSFNPTTGTFRGYDGRDHFCVAN
ncbi:BA14K family protein [Hoeflea ulvae]|uniref:Lectin-like protein BA14k n=1 Tax=Hoeflea ulvae TaxID=2983764 RepID=A0ABT3YJR9_9HYPH|nr:BA14K family protein [Hoeflea ulvae]MCY0096146.1 BA14K family protein [Hoeflea ulvae]